MQQTGKDTAPIGLVQPLRAETYIMIRENLQQRFNEDQWRQIQQYNEDWSLKLQQKILKEIMQSEELFHKYFHLFYSNHVKLFYWFLLASNNHQQIKPYVYRKLISRSQDKYEQDIRNLQALPKAKNKDRLFRIKLKQKQKWEGKSENEQQKKKKLDELSKQIFEYMTKKEKTVSLLNQQKSLTHRKHTKDNSCISQFESKNPKDQRISREKRKSSDNKEAGRTKSRLKLSTKLSKNMRKHDFHDLFIQTFHACDGPRYIFYNYQKHMKGIQDKQKYNMFIRSHQSKGKIVDMRLTESSEQQPICRQLNNIENQNENIRSSYEYSSYGHAARFSGKKSQVFFRRVKSQNIGVFIRK